MEDFKFCYRMKDMEKVILLSDTHRDESFLRKIPSRHPDAHLFWHYGDSELPRRDLQGWVCVQGNCDAYQEYPDSRIIALAGHRFLLVHGNRYLGMFHTFDRLVSFARLRHCDAVCFGHTHVYVDQTVSGIRLLNPGSLRFPRDGKEPSYMRLEVSEAEIHAERLFYR